MTDGSWLKCGVTIENMSRHVERNGSKRKLRRLPLHVADDSHIYCWIAIVVKRCRRATVCDAVASRPELNAANAWKRSQFRGKNGRIIDKRGEGGGLFPLMSRHSMSLRTALKCRVSRRTGRGSGRRLVGEADSKTEDLWFQAQAARKGDRCNIFHDILALFPFTPSSSIPLAHLHRRRYSPSYTRNAPSTACRFYPTS